jgi:hypothetical protein
MLAETSRSNSRKSSFETTPLVRSFGLVQFARLCHQFTVLAHSCLNRILHIRHVDLKTGSLLPVHGQIQIGLPEHTERHSVPTHPLDAPRFPQPEDTLPRFRGEYVPLSRCAATTIPAGPAR